MLIRRRQFLKGSIAVVPAAAAMPAVFSRAVAASVHENTSEQASTGNRTLVVVQMAGGNDGLNTVIPTNDDAYYDLRKGLAVPQTDILSINGQAGLHPSLASFKELWEEGVLAVVEGVGYPDQSFSHFESMDIWQTADPYKQALEGWLGRYLQGIAGEQVDGLHALVADGGMPRALYTENVSVPLVRRIDEYKLREDPRNAQNQAARTEALLRLYASSPGATRFGALLDNTLQAAQRSSQAVQRAHEQYVPAVEYGESRLSQGLRLIAEAIDAELGLRVGHVRIGGFDTHAAQLSDHGRLLAETADAIRTFYRDLQGARTRPRGGDHDLVGVRPAGDQQCQRRDRPWLGGAAVPSGHPHRRRTVRGTSPPQRPRQKQPQVHHGFQAGLRIGPRRLAGRPRRDRSRRAVRAPAIAEACGPTDVAAVLPYAPDAWYTPVRVKIGYEISCARYFYKPQPLRQLGGDTSLYNGIGAGDGGTAGGDYGWRNLIIRHSRRIKWTWLFLSSQATHFGYPLN